MCQQVSLNVFDQIYPREVICEQLSVHHAWEERERCLNMVVLLYVLLAAALWTRLALPPVLGKLARPLLVLGLPLPAMHAVGSAISYRRPHFGSAPLKSPLPQGCHTPCTTR